MELSEEAYDKAAEEEAGERNARTAEAHRDRMFDLIREAHREAEMWRLYASEADMTEATDMVWSLEGLRPMD